MSLTQAITRMLSETIARKGVARIAFPGGRSAIDLMTELSRASIDWSSVRVTLVDERAVDESSDASNARLVKSTLCVNRASDATFEPMLIGHDAASSADQLNQRQRPLDVVILGMGDDGHFASLFPGDIAAPGLDDGQAGFVATSAIGSPAVPRISMTLKHILSAQLVVLLVSSEAKEAKVMAGLRSIDAMNPISYVLASDDPIIVEWPDRTLTTIQRGAIHES